MTGVMGWAAPLLTPLPLDEASRVYACPEWRDSVQGDVRKADVFALGAVMLHMARLWLPLDFHTTDIVELHEVIKSSVSNFEYSDDFKTLLSDMLSTHPETRPSINTVLQRAKQPIGRFILSKKINPAETFSLHFHLIENPTTDVVQMEPLELLSALEEMKNEGRIHDLVPIYVDLFRIYCAKGDKMQLKKPLPTLY